MASELHKIRVGIFVCVGFALLFASLLVWSHMSFSDNPKNYEGQPGLRYLDNLKASWDETRPVMGEIGKYYVCARRSGDDWYIGMIGDDTAPAYSVMLSFLEKGKTYTARIFQDSEESAHDATKIDIVTRRNIKKGDILPIRTVRNGGYVAILKADK